MYRLIESILIENRQPHLMEYHNRRFNNACRDLFNMAANFDLNRYIKFDPGITNERYKYRILFDGDTFETHIQRYIQRKTKTLRLVKVDDIEYPYKTTDRQKLDEAFGWRNYCDDVIIVRKGMITDAYFSNILLFDGKNWITPAKPLLKGVQRAFLLDKKRIIEKDVSIDEIYNYKYIKLINAMIPFEKADVVDVPKDVFEL